MATATAQVYRKVKLYNDNDKPYDQTVNGTHYYIEPKKSIEVPRREGVTVKGHFCGDGVVTKLRIEPIYEDVPSIDVKDTEYKCPITDKVFKSKADFDAHLEGLRKKLR